ncbi:MAG: hypothetical protein LBR20_08360 [Propionibacteriaceae bacterium]|jgi:hypothetical protein|nr:hypothetical protein [Propionibacteriaceae bacterium]
MFEHPGAVTARVLAAVSWGGAAIVLANGLYQVNWCSENYDGAICAGMGPLRYVIICFFTVCVGFGLWLVAAILDRQLAILDDLKQLKAVLVPESAETTEPEAAAEPETAVEPEDAG